MNTDVMRAGAQCAALILLAVSIHAAEQTPPEEQAPAPPAPAATGETTLAVWKERDLDFTYRSPVATHTCQDLRYRVASVLVAVGARPDIEVQADGCDAVIDSDMQPQNRQEEPWRTGSQPFTVDRFDRSRLEQGQQSHVRIRLRSPIVATPDAMNEWQKEKSRSELVARVTGNPNAVLQMTGQFPAEWQTVTLSRRSIELEPEDCALLEQMSQTVMRKLSVRKIHMGSTCDFRHASRLPPQLTVEALISNPFARVPVEEPAPTVESEPSAAPEGSAAPPTTPAAQ